MRSGETAWAFQVPATRVVKSTSTNAPGALAVESSTFFYPGWEVQIDGTPTPVNVSPIRGTMQFAVPAGQHVVSLELSQTPLRRKAWLATIATLLLFAAAIGVERALVRNAKHLS
jgi:hypothetical protein